MIIAAGTKAKPPRNAPWVPCPTASNAAELSPPFALRSRVVTAAALQRPPFLLLPPLLCSVVATVEAHREANHSPPPFARSILCCPGRSCRRRTFRRPNLPPFRRP